MSEIVQGQKKVIEQLVKEKGFLDILNGFISYMIPHRSDVRGVLNVGGGSYTDGKKVVVGIPEWVYEMKEEEILLVMRALAIHECQHVNSSNFYRYKTYFKNLEKHYSTTYPNLNYHSILQVTAKFVANGTEDGRIEWISVNRRPGTMGPLKFLRAIWWKNQEIEGVSPFFDFLFAIVTYATMGVMPKGWSGLYDNDSEEQLLFNQIKPMIMKAARAKNSRLHIEACYEIMETMEPYIVSVLQNEFSENELNIDNSNMTPDYSNEQDKEEEDGLDSFTNEVTFSKSSKDEESNEESENDVQNQDEGEQNKSDLNEEISEKEGVEDTRSSEQDEIDESEKGCLEETKKEKGNEQNEKEDDGKDVKKEEEEKKEEGVEEKSDDELIEEEIEKVISESESLLEDSKKKIKAQEIKVKKLEEEFEQNTDLNQEQFSDILKLSKGIEVVGVQAVRYAKGLISKVKLPPLLRKRGMNFRKEVQDILKNKEGYSLRNQKSGIVDSSSLWKVSAKNYNVFIKKSLPMEIDYAAYILWDGSGSMEGKKYEDSAEAIAVAEEGLRGLLPFKIVQFTTERTNGYAVHRIVKDFDQTEGDRNFTYSFYNELFPKIYNADGLAIRIATQELLERPEKEKILIIFSDGIPSSYVDEEDGIADVEKAVKEARKKGIFLLSVFMEDEEMKDYLDADEYQDYRDNFKKMYGNNLIMTTPSNLERHLIRTLKKVLMNH